jgi:hypothetical protein
MYAKRNVTGSKKHQHHIAQWLISREMMDHTMRALRVRAKLERDYDIPYLAGYSLDGSTVYIDRHMPKSFVYRKRRVLTDRFLMMHECVEKSLIQLYGMHYLHAHQIALHAEQAVVRAEGIEWKAYDDFMQKHIKTIEDERVTKIPAQLDLTPYVDFHDAKLVKQMRLKMV